MKRRHLIELHEQPWYPASLRRNVQDALGSLICRINLYGAASPRLAKILHEVGAEGVMDLCSGASDPIVQLCQQAAQKDSTLPKLHVYLTDLYPNVQRFREHQKQHPDMVRFSEQPIDATCTQADTNLPRVRTILSALHHFKPEQVKDIFEDAAKHADAIIVLDVPPRSWRSLLSILMSFPMMYGLCLTRRASWRRRAVLSTVIFPVVPLTLWVDGIVSHLRAYTPEELLGFADSADSDNFVWESGTLPAKGLAGATYLFGQRRKVTERAA